MPDLTCFFQINVQARSLGTQYLTSARKYIPNEKKVGGKGGKNYRNKTKINKQKRILKFTKNINKMDFTN